MLRALVDCLVELLGKRSKDEAEFMESQFIFLSGIKVDHMVELDPCDVCIIPKVFCSNVTFISIVD